MPQAFDIIGEISKIEAIAVGTRIRILKRLQAVHGRGRWRKCKGLATVRFEDGHVCFAEVHWYEAHGIGRRDMKIKRPIED